MPTYPDVVHAVRRRLRVVVYSADEAVAAEATAALASAGVRAPVVGDSASLLSSLTTRGAQVAVIDAGGSFALALRLVSPIRAQHPRVRVILVDCPHRIAGDGAVVVGRAEIAGSLARAVLDAYLYGFGLHEAAGAAVDTDADPA